MTKMASPDKSQELYWAIEAGEAKTVEACLNEGFPVNHVYPKKYGQTPLHQATVLERVEIVDILLRHGADANAQAGYLQTPLHDAASNGNVVILEKLLNSGAKVDVCNKHEETPLQVAFRNDKIKIIEVLMTNGASPAIKDRIDVTPLHWASRHGQTHLVKRLLDIPEIDVDASDVNGWTPLFEAACYMKTDVLELLLDKGANVNKQDSMGWTTLHYASAKGREEVIRILLKYKADVSIRDKKHETARLKACTNREWRTVKILLDHGDVGDTINDKDAQGRTLLHRSSIYCQDDIVKSLLDKGSDIDTVDENGWTALHYAIHSGKSDTVKRLLMKKANVNCADNEGITPLHRASIYGKEDIVENLILHGAKVNVSDKKGWTSLHHAASGGKLNVVNILTEKMQNVDVVDKEGFTPLHVAAKYGYPAVVKELLMGGADIKPSFSNKTPCDLAEEAGHSGIVQVFKEFLADGLPIELKLLDSKLADGFEKSLRFGFYYSYLGKIMFVGNESVGKTAIARLLLGKKPKRKRKPTEGIDIHTNRAAIDRDTGRLIPKVLKFEDTAYSNLFMRKTEDFKKPKFSPSKENVQDDIITQHVQEDIITQHVQEHLNTQYVQEDIITQHVQEDIIEPTLNDEENLDNLSFCFDIAEEIDDNEDSVSSVDYPLKRASSVRSLFKPQKYTVREVKANTKKRFRLGARKAGSKGIHKIKLAPVIILDFAGQEVFYSTHQSFLTHRGVYVIVINGSLRLDDKIESEVFIPGKLEVPTTRGYIKFWVNSILCYSKGKSQSFPKIIICCTHKDKIDERKIHEQRTYIYDEIDKMFSDSSASSHLITHHRIFINAIDPTDPEFGIFKCVVVDTIMSQPTWGEKMPKAWIHLEMEINKKAKQGYKIIEMKKLRKINKLNPIKVMNDSEINLYLQVHHSIGNIMYFPLPGLRDHVIISPSFLIDALKMIVTDKRFVKDKRLDIWQCLNSEGKLLKIELFKMFGNHADFARYKEFLINLMCHLDMLTEPQVFDQNKGCIIESDFFYVPSMVKSGSGNIFSDASVLKNSIGFSFKFNTSILPSAIGFRLIACCLHLWKVGQYKPKNSEKPQNLLFSGMVVVVVNRFVRLIVKVKDDRIDIFLTHNRSRFDIKADTATSTRECLTDILQRITDSYKILSAGTSEHATSTFQIEYTCFNVISPCYCHERIEWTCSHGDLITKDILNKWFADRTIKDDDCPRDCKGITAAVLKSQPSEIHLGKLSLLLSWENLKAILLYLDIVMDEIDEIEYDFQGLQNIKFLCLRKWTMKFPSCKFEQIHRAMKDQSQDTHILCKIFRDRHLETNLDYDTLEKEPTAKDIHSIAKGVIQESLLLCVHLEIQANDWLQMKADGLKIAEINREILNQWITSHPGTPKLREVAEALCNVGRSIDIFVTDAI